jgi:hypothetical protein
MVTGLYPAKKLNRIETNEFSICLLNIYIVHLLLKHRTQLTVTHSGNHRSPVTHMAMSHPAEPNWRTMSELTINIPEPIMEPTTSMVPSINQFSFKFLFVIFLHYF